MDTLAARLKATRLLRGMTQMQLAKLSGTNQSDISKLERGDTERSTQLIDLAQALSCDPHWLGAGQGFPPDRSPPTETWSNQVDRQALGFGNCYPLLNGEMAAQWVQDSSKRTLSPNGMEYISCPVKLGRGGFCLRLRDNAMRSQTETFSFPEGINLGFSLTEQAHDQDFVCVLHAGAREVGFRQLVHLDEAWWLYSLNPDWPNPMQRIQAGDRIVGRLMYAGWSLHATSASLPYRPISNEQSAETSN